MCRGTRACVHGECRIGNKHQQDMHKRRKPEWHELKQQKHGQHKHEWHKHKRHKHNRHKHVRHKYERHKHKRHIKYLQSPFAPLVAFSRSGSCVPRVPWIFFVAFYVKIQQIQMSRGGMIRPPHPPALNTFENMLNQTGLNLRNWYIQKHQNSLIRSSLFGKIHGRRFNTLALLLFLLRVLQYIFCL